MTHNLLLLHPSIEKSYQPEKGHRYFMNRSDLHYISFPDDKNVLCCTVSSGHFCRLDTALHQVDGIPDCSYFLLKMTGEKISKYCQISILNQTRDQAICIEKMSGP